MLDKDEILDDNEDRQVYEAYCNNSHSNIQKSFKKFEALKKFKKQIYNPSQRIYNCQVSFLKTFNFYLAYSQCGSKNCLLYLHKSFMLIFLITRIFLRLTYLNLKAVHLPISMKINVSISK